MEIDQINEVFTTIKQKFGFFVEPQGENSKNSKEKLEATIELDPGTFDKTYLQRLSDIGFNRISIGLQTFQKKIFQKLGRGHQFEEIQTSLNLIEASSFNNINADLIFGLPQQNTELWKQTLKEVLKRLPKIKHLSTYLLSLEGNSPFNRNFTEFQFPLPAQDELLKMFEISHDFLEENGFDHYQISSYAKEGYRSLHNQVYWSDREFAAFGMGAASYTEKTRFTRPKNITQYFEFVGKLEVDGDFIKNSYNQDSMEDSLKNFVMLGLRTKEGIQMRKLREIFGATGEAKTKEFWKVLEEFFKNIDGNLYHREEGKIRLNRKAGFLLSNSIISSLFQEIEKQKYQ